MQIILILLSIYMICRIVFREYNFFEIISLAILFFIAEIGTLPFFVNEYLSMSFYDASKYILIANIFVLFLSLFMFKPKISNIFRNDYKFNKFEIFIVLIMLILNIRNLIIPVRGWDAYSMYDGRAYMLSDNIKIKDMVKFNKYDDFNYMYYVSYPPMTSVAHAVIYSNNIKTPMFLYSLLFASVVFMLYSMIKEKVRSKYYLFGLLAISAFFPPMFDQVNVAYTNLVAISFQVGSIFLIHKYLNKNSHYLFILSSVFLALSNWTRSLEPIFFAIFIGSVYVYFIKSKNNIYGKLFIIFLNLIIVLSPIIFWRLYISSNLGNIGGTSQISLFEVIRKIPESLFINNIIEVIFFVYKSLLPLKYYFVLLLVSGYYWWEMKAKSIELNYINMMVILSLLIMIAGTFYFSVSYVWWSEISGSFLRSNLILVPLTALVVANIIKVYDKK